MDTGDIIHGFLQPHGVTTSYTTITILNGGWKMEKKLEPIVALPPRSILRVGGGQRQPRAGAGAAATTSRWQRHRQRGTAVDSLLGEPAIYEQRGQSSDIRIIRRIKRLWIAPPSAPSRRF